MKDNDKLVIVEEIFNCSIKKVWNSITDLNEMKQWYFNNIPSFKPEVGFKTEFMVQSQERKFTHLWTVTAIEPFKKIGYNWKYKEYAGNSFVYFELFDEKNKTLLRVTSKVIESFPEDIPEFKSESCREGWNYFIKQHLKNYLENKV
tara:strand:- start:176 stop:616 length:441 start_codon:yes stop_codon:yes gene_type:complete